MTPSRQWSKRGNVNLDSVLVNIAALAEKMNGIENRELENFKRFFLVCLNYIIYVS